MDGILPMWMDTVRFWILWAHESSVGFFVWSASQVRLMLELRRILCITSSEHQSSSFQSIPAIFEHAGFKQSICFLHTKHMLSKCSSSTSAVIVQMQSRLGTPAALVSLLNTSFTLNLSAYSRRKGKGRGRKERRKPSLLGWRPSLLG